MWRMDRVDEKLGVLPMRPSVLYYLLWLVWQVVLSNIDLVRRIWDPTLPIRPTWQRLDIKVTSTLAKTLYANSITLTPGTITVHVTAAGKFSVHCIDTESGKPLPGLTRPNGPQKGGFPSGSDEPTRRYR